MNPFKLPPWAQAGITVLLVLILIVILSEHMQTVHDFIRSSGWVGVLASIGIYGLLGLTPIPSEPLTVLLSTIYGPLAATFVSGVGNLFAALMEYALGARLGGISSFEQRRASLPFRLGRLPVDSALFLLAARMLPGYGPKFVSVISGMYRVPLYRYLWTAAIPTFLGSALFAYGGFSLLQMTGWGSGIWK